ncbi:hypothetical protein CCACVL1_10763 [Corchorus capsularis]|uniref:Uncharacterized protein n=1 Tax=Corchorus capsularis TaxID=210143 RepID=A0A1R3IPS5_COCAP|nr:hypothetical protein CCACVL1_10763 [Corchorus capsularis]
MATIEGEILILSSIPVTLSEIKNTGIFDDNRAMILFESFGFGKNGHIEISPMEKNPYLVINDEEEIAAAQMLEEDGYDDFEL